MMQKRRANSHTKTDKLDLSILKVLSERGRITISGLSKVVGLSATPCAARLERLESEGLISGYRADVNVEMLADLSLYYVTIAIKNWTAPLAKKVEAALLANPYVVSCDYLFGPLDYLVRMYARSTQHYHELMAPLEAFEVDYTTYPVSKQIMGPQLDRLIAQLAAETR